jgi:hypothetical protein
MNIQVERVADVIARAESWHNVDVPLVVVDADGKVIAGLKFRACTQSECAFEMVAP